MEILIDHVNFETLPVELKKAFLSVAAKYQYSGYGVAINKFAINDIEFYHDMDFLKWDNGELPFTLSVTDYDYSEFMSTYANGVSKGKNEAQKILSMDFPLGREIEHRAFRIFSEVFNNQNLFDEFPVSNIGGEYVIKHSEFFEYGIKIGRFVGCWEIILGNAIEFEKLFATQAAAPSVQLRNRFKSNLLQIELLEITKAMIEIKSIEGVQKEIIEDFAAFFDIKIPNQDKSLSDLKNRNSGSETLYLDKLRNIMILNAQKNRR